MKVTSGGTKRAVEKYGIASVIHRHTIRSNRDRHLPAARLLGVIGGTASEIAKTRIEIPSPWRRTAGNISSEDLVCSSVANRSEEKSSIRSD